MRDTSCSSNPTHTDCCIVGGGPGGMILALLLARLGIEVTLLESHLDFDRDFRGDTIHPSTLELMDTLGFAQELLKIPHSKLRAIRVTTPEGYFQFAEFSRLPTRFPYIMMLPQNQFLQYLADQARKYPNFHLLMGAQGHDLIREDGVVRGIHYKQENGMHSIRATLTVGADGRFSRMRKLAGLEPIRTAPPMDVVWFRLPRNPEDQHDLSFMVDNGKLTILLEREELWQIGYIIPKGSYIELKAAGIDQFRKDLTRLIPWMGARMQGVEFSDLQLLSVESSRLKRWYVPGLLLIGDAAHVMSPVGGVGISYAIQDAVATANLLCDPLRRGEVKIVDLAAVQNRREWPTRVIQTFQGFMQKRFVAVALNKARPFHLPLPVRMFLNIPYLRDLPARLIAFGIQQEHPRRD